jgi:uncharacterized protein (TIGR00730 family)
MKERIVAIFGSGQVKPGDEAYKIAYKTGRLLAEAGFTIINGGYGGIMIACAEAAVKAGGKTIGVTCRAFGRSGANKYITREVETKTLDERLSLLIKTADAYIVLPGSTGTLLELAAVWELKNKGFIDKDKPFILIGDFWRPLVELVTKTDKQSSRYLRIVDKPAEILEILKI